MLKIVAHDFRYDPRKLDYTISSVVRNLLERKPCTTTSVSPQLATLYAVVSNLPAKTKLTGGSSTEIARRRATRNGPSKSRYV